MSRSSLPLLSDNAHLSSPFQNESPIGLSDPQSSWVDLLGLPFEELEVFLDQCNVGRTHAKRVFRGLHYTHQDLDQIPNLGRHAHTLEQHSFFPQLTLINSTCAQDGTYKLLFEVGSFSGKTKDGHSQYQVDGQVEAVLLPMRRERYTLCLSTQVGCAMGCSFCATGTLGLKRSLRASEIVAQVYYAQSFIQKEIQDQRSLSHLVFMGMGEPLHDFEATRCALEILLDQRGVCFKSRHITVSTVGLIPNLRRFSHHFEGRVQLALSLHAGTDQVRQNIIPVAKKWKLADLKRALLDHPLPNSRVLMLEYVVLPGVNDGVEELDGVAEFCKGLRALVNLIPFNPFPNSPYRSPTSEEVLAVDQGLKKRGVPCSIRVTRGQEKSGACGQLALQGF